MSRAWNWYSFFKTYPLDFDLVFICATLLCVPSFFVLVVVDYHMKYKECYAAAQWDKPHKQGECKVCVELRKEEGTPLDCRKCLQWKSELAFPLNKRTAGSDKTRVCVNSIETRQCKMCALHKNENDFTQSEWEMAAWKRDARGKCKECMGKHEKLMWQCIACDQTYDLSFYRKWLQHHNKNKTKLVRCDTCILADEQQRQQEHAKTFVRCKDIPTHQLNVPRKMRQTMLHQRKLRES